MSDKLPGQATWHRDENTPLGVRVPLLPEGFDMKSTKEHVNHPKHYCSHPSGVECIQITEHMNFNLGNAIKYIWRAGLKSDSPLEDLHKAKWYVEREIARLNSLV